MDLVRKLILEKLSELGLGMAEVSLLLDRNETYLQQFLKKGSPRELRERERARLAEILKVPEEQLRGPSAPLPKRAYEKHATRESLIDVGAAANHIAKEGAHKIIAGASLYADMDLPVFGTSPGVDGTMIITDRPADWVARPSVLLRVADGYGMIVTGDSMDPVLKAGWTALINPHLPPRVGDLCLFRSHHEGADHAKVKEFRGETETAWKVREYKPDVRDFALKKSEWNDRPQRIVGSYFT